LFSIHLHPHTTNVKTPQHIFFPSQEKDYFEILWRWKFG
jgi:hypothetical protein